jgi:hypothetical protein
MATATKDEAITKAVTSFLKLFADDLKEIIIDAIADWLKSFLWDTHQSKNFSHTWNKDGKIFTEQTILTGKCNLTFSKGKISIIIEGKIETTKTIFGMKYSSTILPFEEKAW